MKAAMQLLGHDPDELEIAITQMVDFARGGEEVKMSGRSGDFIALDDVIAEVGADAARFTYLMQSVDSRQTFDLEEVAKQGMDNPVFYVQYAHARICSIFAKAAEAGVERLVYVSSIAALYTGPDGAASSIADSCVAEYWYELPATGS